MRANGRNGFTILEMLIAMAVTLLLMGALAQAFAVIGEKMQSSRAQVNLSNQLRGIGFRIRNDLDGLTSRNSEIPASISAGSGYFLYYDGPSTDSTGTLFGEGPSVINETTYQDSRYGDFDDYIAFTAEAPGDEWFTGKVPAYLVDRSLEDTPAGMAPTMIRSKYAEIIYWISPEVTHNAGGFVSQNASTGMPLYRDNDTDGIPDQFQLHRRVLLIRPDLNDPVSDRLPTSDFTDASSGTSTAGVVSGSAYINTTPALADATAIQASGWIDGMAMAHQFFDISIRRVPRDARTGSLATSDIAANSLADLTAPENRFAHVRIPGRYLGLPNNVATSMPMLALWFEHQEDFLGNVLSQIPKGRGLNVGGTELGFFNGFLLPQFELSNRAAVLSGDLRWDRTGEDVIARNVIAFDVQGYDPTAWNYLTVGADGAAGVAGFDDDGNGTPDDGFELGAAGSDDTVLTVQDIGIRDAIWNETLSTYLGPTPATQGEYVDLGYVYQAGSALNLPTFLVSNTDAAVQAHFSSRMTSAFSAFTGHIGTPTSPVDYRSSSANLAKSGRALFPISGSNSPFFFQPVYDTFTDHYESDGFDQGFPIVGSNTYGGTCWILNNTSHVPLHATQHPAVPTGTLSRARIDEGTNGIDEEVSTLASPNIGIDDPSELETSPPFLTAMPSIKIRIRLEDTKAREVLESSVIHALD